MNSIQNDLSPDLTTVDGLDNLFESGMGAVMPVRGDNQSTLDITADTIVSWTLAEAANNLGLSKRTILRKLKTGHLQGRKVIGINGPEWCIQPIDTPDMTSAFVKTSVRGVTGDNQSTEDVTHDKTIQALLKVIEVQAEQLKAASDVMTYQRIQLEEKEQQLKLLTDSQHKPKWWQRFGSWFVGSERAD